MATGFVAQQKLGVADIFCLLTWYYVAYFRAEPGFAFETCATEPHINELTCASSRHSLVRVNVVTAVSVSRNSWPTRCNQHAMSSLQDYAQFGLAQALNVMASESTHLIHVEAEF